MTFEEVYDAHFDFVWRALRQLGVRESDALDAAQDVFVVVHRQLDAFEGRSKITTWLYGIAVRVASARRRLAHVRREVMDSDVLEVHPASQPDVGAAAERGQELALLEALLDRMPEEQRTVFVMFELGDMSGEEIAAALGVAVGTVRSRLRLARESFREATTRMQARERFQEQRLQGGVR